ncbi:decorin-binding protein DbpA (plasmid) [Borrelia sp. CA_690]|uniref:Cytochrome D ubiquinol oxidase subunit II n=1 Tax=Borrelia maritima TaxID=2761123 RepID=A0A5J6WBL4_9SPIR|nr:MULTISPECIES: decorin-binding protein DbpA [Borrelia]QFI14980.1 cytochrome D ubiquinol oxidase subunit II [Borrelia maritima]WKC83974.1 decorin-binding protein DbpA [Borrelia sp. CA_690]
MNKDKIIFKNLLTLALLVNLLMSCGLTGEMKVKLESSVKNVKDEIDQIRKDAALKGVNFGAFTDTKTGVGVSGKPDVIRNAKLRAIAVAETFIQAIKEEATKIKESGSSWQFSAMFDLMLKVSKALEDVGIQHLQKTLLEEAENSPANTGGGILEIAKKMEEKLYRVKLKQQQDQSAGKSAKK